MYREDSNKVSFVRVLLRILLFVLIFILVIKLIVFLFNRGKVNTANEVMQSNLTVLKDVGIKIVKEDNFDLKIGETKVYKLQDLINDNKATELKDEKDNVCSNEYSYVEITRTQTEYRIKTYVSCDNIQEDKYTYLDVNTKEELTNQDNKTTDTTTTTTTTVKPTTTTTTVKTTTTTKKTTKKATTTKKVVPTTRVKTTYVRTTTTIPSNKAKVSFNTNGGNQINAYIVDKGSVVSLPTPTRNGYTFYRWEDSKGNVYNGSIKVDNSIVLIAKWR